jgi:molybdate transport system substrate-binding protein
MNSGSEVAMIHLHSILVALVVILPASGADLLVAAASDLAPLGPSLEASFARSTGQRVRFTFASSGSLTRQIENGAPYDVFLSASEQYAKDLVAGGHADGATLTIVAVGRLGLWSLNGRVQKLTDLMRPSVQHIAIANPEHAPYGVAAKQLLERQGLWKPLQPKMVYGENVRQALQFAESGNADAVITAWTLLKGRGILIAAEWHDPIRQAGVVVKSTQQPAEARRFLVFLTEPASQKLLEDSGLTILRPPSIPSAKPTSARRTRAK